MVVDTLGLVLFLVGVLLVVLELANPGYFIGVAGTTAIIVGLIQMMTEGWLFNNQWAPFIVAGIAFASLLGSVEFYRRFAPAVKAPETLSSDAFVGKRGKVVRRIDPDTLKGRVRVEGLEWSATGDRPVEEGQEIVVRKVDGVHLVVEPAVADKPPEPPGEPHG